jgi:signal transduction histidine kinase/ligand-binding sensor domain-containing protein
VVISKKILLLFLACFACSFSHAQQTLNKTAENKFRAVHWTIYDGISQGENYSMIKDASGFLWIGSRHGLNRFDGNIIKNYYHDPHNKRTIAGNLISGFIEDSLHNIWIGTEMGLSRCDIKADTFSNFPPAKDVDPDHPSIPFWATKDKVFALEGYHITVYNIHSFRKKEVAALTDKDGFGFGPSDQYAIFDAASNGIWMLHGSHHDAAAGLLNISLSDGKKQYFTWPCFLHIPNHDHSSEAMRYDRKRNAIWINSSDGLVEFTLADKKFHHIDAMNDVLKLKNYFRFVGIDLDRRGRVWLATAPKGILIYDPSTKSLSVPFPKDSLLQRDVSEANSIIYCDRDGITWCGYWLRKGFYGLVPFSPAVKLYTPEPKQALGFGNNMAFMFQKAEGGKLWIVTAGSLYQFDRRTEELNVINLKDFPGLKGNNPIVTVLIDNFLHKVWIENGEGYFVMNLQTKKILPIVFKDSSGEVLDHLDQKNFLPFRNGWIIIGAYNNKKYIFTGNRDSATARAIFQVPFNTANDFRAATDQDHLLFLKRNEADGNLTYSFRNGEWSQVHHKMDSLQWISIFFDKRDKTYWVAAENKLFHYDKEFKVIRIYGQQDGLPDLVITGLIADNNGNIWFHTDRTIHQLNVATGEISTLTEKDGFEKQNFALYDLNYKDDNGDIYFGGGIFGSGFDRIVPGKYTNPSSSIYLQSLEVNQKPFPLPTGVNNLKELSLRYFENKITIETGIIDYYSKGTSHMRYKLEGKGLNENWQYGPANYTIRFEGLQPGNYTLRMQASNAALQFNGPEKILIIAISPPWYKTWWAYLIFIILIAISIWAFIYYRSIQLLKDNRILEHKVQERTEEVIQQKEEIEAQRDSLENAITELKVTQKQLIQSEKMASLGELTAGIAHEIQNPLNFINNFSEVSWELITEMKEEIDKGDTDEVKHIAADIEQNLEKINHHGKRADAIVKGMLQHSRQSTGNKEPTDINVLADEYLRLAYHGLRAKDKTFNAAMHTDFDKRIGKVNVIPQDIGRMLLNLFNNAFYAVTEKTKAAGVGYHPAVTVNTKAKSDAVIITVSDNGYGIPKNVTDKIFQPFFTTKPTGQGTGLGLSLVYDIIKVHGGDIKVETKEGEGTSFIISLPV